jgi:geranylgeranyl reductase family protein
MTELRYARCAVSATPFDALVIGAGPAGSVAAIELARGGARVALVDKHEFPRDKTCGDALIPDALAVLQHLSLKARVLASAKALDRICFYAPNGTSLTIHGQCACLPRWTLDDLLREEAVRAGAVFMSKYRLKRALLEDSIRGAVFELPGGTLREIRARTTVLATGAAAECLKVFNVCRRVGPSAIAARMYVESHASIARDFEYLCISYHRQICPGYGWIFPGPDNQFNVGVGFFHDAGRVHAETTITHLFDRFVESFDPARELMRQAKRRSLLKGAPLRTGLEGADLAVPGLLVVGDAAGLTYSFSGEGIGKAMESGSIAARVILADAARRQPSPTWVAATYARQIREAFTARFRAYKAAQDWLSSPALVDALVWKAQRSPYVIRQLEGMFQETVDPDVLFSRAGMLRALVS